MVRVRLVYFCCVLVWTILVRSKCFKSCPRVPKLQIWLLRGWGRCLKVTPQTFALETFRWCRWGAERKYFGASVWEGDNKKILNISGDSKHFSFKKNKLLSDHRGQGGGVPQILFFVWLKTICKISETYNYPFWEKSNPAERKKREEREKNAVNSGHLVLRQRTQAARTNIANIIHSWMDTCSYFNYKRTSL